MIQRPSSVVLGLMTAAIRIPASFDAPRFRRIAQQRFAWLKLRRPGRRCRIVQGDQPPRRMGRPDRRDRGEPRSRRLRRSLRFLRAAGERLFAEDRDQRGASRGPGAGDDARCLAQGPLYDPGTASAATWIFTIARNLRIDSLRRERRGGAIQVEEVEAEYEVDDSPLADARLLTAEAEARVRKALKTLPPDQLRVIELSFFEERPHGEIARTLKIPLGTVKSRVRLAMRRLRGLLDELQ